MADGVGSQRQRQETRTEAGHPGAVQQSSGGAVRLRGVLTECGVPAGEDGNEWKLVAGGQRVGCCGVFVGGWVVGSCARRLQPNQMAENLISKEVVALRDDDELGADGVAFGGETRAVAGLHEDTVQRERQQRRIVQTARQLLGLERRLAST